MSFQINQYAINKGKCYPIQPSEAPTQNELGADIYWTPNNFVDFGKRKKEDLQEITSFFCEIDGGEKNEQIEKISKFLKPSCVIETKRGFHVYWYLEKPMDCTKDPVKAADWFRDILKNRICPALNADTQAADACRILRMPFYRYWKDGEGEFFIDIVFESENKYTPEQVLKAFPMVQKFERAPVRVVNKNQGDGSFWFKAGALDVIESLKVLSGTSHVMGERYEFKNKGNLTRLIINGKPSNAWIDAKGTIGSTDGAGPGLANWLYWYHKDWKKVAQIFKEVLKSKTDSCE
jgi:hypothetical protein